MSKSLNSEEVDPLVTPQSKIMSPPDSVMKSFFAGSITYEELSTGEKGSILKYNERFATSIGWIFTRPGSIFTLIELISVIVLGAGSATGLEN